MIKVTFEFPTIDAAIVAMGKMVGAPQGRASLPTPTANTEAGGVDAPTSRTRKPRNDAGKPRGPYKESNANTVVEAGETAGKAGTVAAGAQGIADTSKEAEQAANSTSTPPAPAVAPSAEDAQEIFAKVFDVKGILRAKELLQRYGVGRVRELLEGQRQGFIAECSELLKEAA
jgi:hypothetical protein